MGWCVRSCSQWTTRLTCNLSHPWLDMDYGAPAPLETMIDQPARAGLEKPWAYVPWGPLRPKLLPSLTAAPLTQLPLGLVEK